MTTTVDTAALTAALDKIDAALADAHFAVIELPDLVPPVARGDAIEIGPGDTADIDLWANDEPGSSPIASARVLTNPIGGTVTIDRAGHATIVASNNAGDYTAVYQDIGADGAESVPATIAITVTEPDIPPPPPPPPPPVIGARGVHACSSNQGDGPPPDIIGATDALHVGLTPRAPWPRLCAVWPGMAKIELMRPGKSIKADFFRRVTDNGSRVLVQMPLAFQTPPPGWGDPFAAVLAGKVDQAWADFLGWMASQGQTAPILRIVEPNGAGKMPHAIGNCRNANTCDFSDAKAAYAYALRKWRQLLPGAHLVMSHFRRGYVVVNGHDVLVHPDEYCPDPKLYDGDHVDHYDNPSQTMTPANAEVIFKLTAKSHDGKTAPAGLDSWAAYAASRHHTCGIDESGIRCLATDPSERDNAYFFEAQEARAKQLKLMHIAFFRPNGKEHKIFPQANNGGTKARDAFVRLYNVAG